MRILYSRTQFWFNLKAGGSVGHTAGVINGLSRFGRIEIISNERLYGVDAVPCTVVKPFFKKELFYNFQFAPELAGKARQFKPDFIYHRYSGSSVATARVCRQTGIPLVLEFNGSDAWVLQYWLRDNRSIKDKIYMEIVKPILKYTEKFNLKTAFLIVVVSESLKKGLLKLGFPAERILVNPNGADPEKFMPVSHERQLAVKKELCIPANRTIIGFSGTFGKWHGIPELSGAIEKLNANTGLKNKLFFILYGDGELREVIEKQVAHFENVHFTGTIEYNKIQDYLSICDILVSPHGNPPDAQEFFGSPTKIFEYMAMGKGIVASNLGQIGEVLKDNSTAVLVEPGNVDDLVRGITHLVSCPDEAERLGKNARESVIQHYTWAKHAEKIINAFEDIKTHGKIRQV